MRALHWEVVPPPSEMPINFQWKYFTGMCSGSEEGSNLRLIDFVALNKKNTLESLHAWIALGGGPAAVRLA